MKTKLVILTLFIALFLTACGSEEAATPAPEPIAAEPEPTDVPPTETAVSPTDTPEPTNTPEPTKTAVPTNTPMPPTAIPNQLGDAWQRPADDMLMLYIPDNTFTMDSDKAAHDVTLDAFWMDQTEVTNTQFAQFVADTGYVTLVETEGLGVVFDTEALSFPVADDADWQHPHGKNSDLTGLEQHPVAQVAWEDATAYCQWAGAELPTSAQWEYAALGTEDLFYPWGVYFPEKGGNACDVNCDIFWKITAVDDGYALTAPVGSYPGDSSWANVLDLGGNVSEWVFDWYAEDYYSKSSNINPTGPASGDEHEIRSGNFYFMPGWMNGTSHYAMSWLASLSDIPTDGVTFDGVGFRCVSNDLDKTVNPKLKPYAPSQREADAAYAESIVGSWQHIRKGGSCGYSEVDTFSTITLEADGTMDLSGFNGHWTVFNQAVFIDVPYFDEGPVPFLLTENGGLEYHLSGELCSKIGFY